MVYTVSPPYQQFTDTDGSPLENGYIWVGVANQDPQTNPAAVYWDSALTLPAAQPIRTLNGYPVNSGTPANVYTVNDYSIQVQNKNGSAIYQSSSSTNGLVSLENRLADSSVISNGDALIAMKQPISGAVSRTVHNKLSEIISVKDFGAVGDGSTDDSAAISAAVAYMVSTGNNVYVPSGTYLSDPFTINSQVYSGQANFVGSDRERCVIKRRLAGAGAFITIGSVSGTVFQSGIGFMSLTIDGGLNTNGDAFLGYDVVRSAFSDVRFTGGAVACHLYGGISISFYNCLFDMAKTGLKVEYFASGAGGGWPNIIRLIGGEIVDNTEWGAWFDHGRLFILRDVDVEGNGTTLAANQGGVYIGSNVGTEVSVTDTYSIGFISDGCWFEANKGIADVSLNNGTNSITNTNFFSQSTMVTNDIVINGGRFFFKNINISFSKTANVLENSGTISGNIIESSDIPNISFAQSKTMVIGSNKINMRDGIVPVFAGFSIPFEQFGAGTTQSGGTINITFPIAFASTPYVFANVNNGDTTTSIISVVVSNISATGFTARALNITHGSSTITSIVAVFSWRAIGSR